MGAGATHAELVAPNPDLVPEIDGLRYSRTLLDGYQAVQKRPLTTRTAEEICSRITGVQMQVRRVPGTALANERTGEIVYTPPESEALNRF